LIFLNRVVYEFQIMWFIRITCSGRENCLPNGKRNTGISGDFSGYIKTEQIF
jgi:hypothetical protein